MSGAPTASSDVIVLRDQAYAEDGRPLLWDVYSPAGRAGDRPVVLLLHGGGWRVGERGMMADAAIELAKLGLVAIAPEYRLLGEAPWPAPLNDVRTAVRAVRAHAKALGANPEQVFLMGFSAGGHLALLAAGAPASSFPASVRPHGELSQAIAGVAAFFPVVSLEGRFGAALGVEGEALEAAGPLRYAADLPPTIIFSGDADPITPVASAIELHQAIIGAGGVADLRLFSRLVHDFVVLPGMMSLTMREAAEFFDRTAINRASADQALDDLKNWWADLMAQAAG